MDHNYKFVIRNAISLATSMKWQFENCNILGLKLIENQVIKKKDPMNFF